MSDLYLDSEKIFRKVDFGHLPLEPISKLKVTTEKNSLEDRYKRLAQIKELPLSRMAVYCEETSWDRQRVNCLLCINFPSRERWERSSSSSYLDDEWKAFLKDEWTFHFRLEHWRYYFSILPESASTSLHDDKKEMIFSRNRNVGTYFGSSFSKDEWIVIEDVARDTPIHTDEEIIDMINGSSFGWRSPMFGPVMTQRFVVIYEGERECLCLGIHT